MPGVLKTHYAVLICFPLSSILADAVPIEATKPCNINILDSIEVCQASHYREILPTLIISKSDIRRFAPLNVADVLHYCAGIQVKDYGGIGGIKTINIRSMGSQHTGIFYDGFQLGNAQNGQIDLGQLSMENVSRISVHQGQRSSIFQSACEFGHSSTVYLSTSPDILQLRSHTDSPVGTRIKMQGGSSGLQRLSLTQGFLLSPMLRATYHVEELSASGKYRFRYRRRNYDGTIAYDTTATRQNGDIQSLLAEGNLYYENGSHHGQVKAYTYHSNRGIPGAIVNNVWHGGERLLDGNTFVQGQWTYDASERYSLRFKARYAHYSTHYTNNDSTRFLADNTFRQNEAYLSLCQGWSPDRQWSFSSSYDFAWNNLHADLPLFTMPQRIRHQLSAAMAHNARHHQAQLSILGTDVIDRQGSHVSFFRNLAPALYMRWMNDNRHGGISFHAFAKHCFRLPTFNDLYYTEMGNCYLKPEKAWQFDLGAQYIRHSDRRHFSLVADLYHNLVTDKIVAYPKGQQFRWTMLNLGKVSVNGLDINIGFRQTHGLLTDDGSLMINLQYTAQQTIDITDSGDPYYRDQIPYVPHHSGSLTVGYEFGNWTANYHFTYVGERWSQQENIRYNHLQPWYTSDVNLQYRIHCRRSSYLLVAEVLNLLDQQYDVIANYPMPGRNFRFSLCAEF